MIEIWVVDTLARAAGPVVAAKARRMLGEAERRRARTLAEGPERTSFVASRIALRSLLAPHRSDLVSGGAFERGPTGKPYVSGGPAFNLSATMGLALVAVSRDGDVGIDVEQVRDLEFSAREFERNPALARFADPPGAGSSGPTLRFLRAWTRFEAVLKFHGNTLGSALLHLSARGSYTAEGVSTAPGTTPAITDLSPRHGYLAACAHQKGASVTCHEFDWKKNGA